MCWSRTWWTIKNKSGETTATISVLDGMCVFTRFHFLTCVSVFVCGLNFNIICMQLRAHMRSIHWYEQLTLTSFIGMCATESSNKYAHHIFNRIPLRSVRGWNMIFFPWRRLRFFNHLSSSSSAALFFLFYSLLISFRVHRTVCVYIVRRLVDLLLSSWRDMCVMIEPCQNDYLYIDVLPSFRCSMRLQTW